MMNEDSLMQIKFEIYKLHTELAEHAAQLREGVNRVFSGILVSIIAAHVLIYRLTPESGTLWILLILGVCVSASWSLSLMSMTGRLKAKNQVLRNLETELPYSFLTEENYEFNKASKLRRKVTGQIFPLALGAFCLSWLIVELICECGIRIGFFEC